MKLTIYWLGLIGLSVRTLWAICVESGEVFWTVILLISLAFFSYLYWVEEERRAKRERRWR